MKTEGNDMPNYKRPGFIAAVIVLALFIVYYSIMSFLGSVRKVNEIQSEYGFIKNEKNPVNEQILSDSAFLQSLKEKAFLQSRIAMAETDSIYLTINLADSTVDLEISGVVVHSTRIMSEKMSTILARGNEYAVQTMLSKPLVIARDFSTIKKEPLMIKMAPKDTSEFVPDIIPDTADYEPVNFILEMHNGIRIYVYQSGKIKAGDGLRQLAFDLWDRIRNTFSSIIKVLTFRIPEYHPYIKIRINRADSKIIYRAIPFHGQVGVYL